MKRLLVILILLFPVVTLALWVYHGMSMRHQPPPASMEQPANTTPTNLPPAK